MADQEDVKDIGAYLDEINDKLVKPVIEAAKLMEPYESLARQIIKQGQERFFDHKDSSAPAAPSNKIADEAREEREAAAKRAQRIREARVMDTARAKRTRYDLSYAAATKALSQPRLGFDGHFDGTEPIFTVVACDLEVGDIIRVIDGWTTIDTLSYGPLGVDVEYNCIGRPAHGQVVMYPYSTVVGIKLGIDPTTTSGV